MVMRESILIGYKTNLNSIGSSENPCNESCVLGSIDVFFRTTHLSSRSHWFVVDSPANRTAHYRENIFLSLISRM